MQHVIEDGKVINEQAVGRLYELVERAVDLNDEALDLQNGEIGHINYELERLRLKEKGYVLDNALTKERVADLQAQRTALRDEYKVFEERLFKLRKQAKRDQVVVRDMRGELVTLPIYQVLDVWFPNDMGTLAKIGHYLSQIGKFVSDVAKLPRIVSLHEFSIKKGTEGQLVFHIVAKTYRYKGK